MAHRNVSLWFCALGLMIDLSATQFVCPGHSDILASQTALSQCTTTTVTTVTMTSTSLTTSKTTFTTVTTSRTTATVTSLTTTKTTVTTNTMTSTSLTSTATTLTTTSLTTTSTTVTTVTSTTSTTTVSTPTSTTSTDTTTSSTSQTTTSTSRTHTSTTDTRSTATSTIVTSTSSTSTPGDPCRRCLLPMMSGCDTVMAGGSCTATLKSQSRCAEKVTPPTLTCPSAVWQWRPPTLASGSYPKVMCKVCAKTVTTDTDGRTGYYTGKIKFGANMVENVIDESDIKQYNLWMVNSSGYKIMGTMIGSVLVKSKNHVLTTCCHVESYSLDVVGLQLSTNYVTILPVDIYDVEMTVGEMVSITDITFGCPTVPPILDTIAATMCTTTTTSATSTATTTLPTTFSWWSTYTVTKTTTVTATTSTLTTLTTFTATSTSMTTTKSTVTTTSPTSTSLTSTSLTVTTATTTVTTQTTITITSTSLTTTKVTSTLTSLTTTSVSTTTTSVSTTTATTSTSTNTITHTTTTTTLPLAACQGSCPALGVGLISGCDSVAGGASCTPSVKTSVCIKQNLAPTFTCPVNNQQNQIASLSIGALVECKVCELSLSSDTDDTTAVYSGLLEWGPNQHMATVTETDITSYKVYFANSAGKKLSAALTTVTALKNSMTTAACCHPNVYSFAMAATTIPATAVSVMVVPVDSSSFEMPYGQIVTILDMTTTTTTTTYTGVTVAPTPSPPGSPSPSVTTTTLALVAEGIAGVIGLDVPDPSVFCGSAAAMDAVDRSLSNVTQVPTNYISSECSTRRLAGENLRRLTAFSIAYLITLPNAAAAASTGIAIPAGVTASTITQAIMGTTPSAMTQVVNAAIQEKISSGEITGDAAQYAVTVTSSSTPTTQAVTMTATTTTSTVTAGTSLQAGVDSMARSHLVLTFSHVVALMAPFVWTLSWLH